MTDAPRFDTRGYRFWAEGRFKNADALGNRSDSSLYDLNDAEVLLCCTLGGAAADTWPGVGKDRKRFIEFLVEYARDACPPMTYISIPLLRAKLAEPDSGSKSDSPEVAEWKVEAVKTLGDRIGDVLGGVGSRILTWTDVDDTDEAVGRWLSRHDSSLSPQETRRRVRSASYAAIIYQDLRCGLTHEFRWTGGLGRWSMDSNTEPHYVNAVDARGVGTRRLCLPYEYIRHIAKHAVEAACSWWDKSEEFTRHGRPNRLEPSCWWIEGR